MNYATMMYYTNQMDHARRVLRAAKESGNRADILEAQERLDTLENKFLAEVWKGTDESRNS